MVDNRLAELARLADDKTAVDSVGVDMEYIVIS